MNANLNAPGYAKPVTLQQWEARMARKAKRSPRIVAPKLTTQPTRVVA